MNAVTIIVIGQSNSAVTRECLRRIVEFSPDVQLYLNVLLPESAAAVHQEFAETFAGLAIHEYSSRFSPVTAINNIVRKTSSDYIALVDSQTWMLYNTIGNARDFMAQMLNCASCGIRLLRNDGTAYPCARSLPSPGRILPVAGDIGERLPAAPHPEPGLFSGWDPDHPRSVEWITRDFLMFRRNAWRRIGGFDERFSLDFAETDFCLLLKQEGWDHWYTPAARALRCDARGRASDGGIPESRLPAQLQDQFRYFRKHYGVRGVLEVAGMEIGSKISQVLKINLLAQAHVHGETRRSFRFIRLTLLALLKDHFGKGHRLGRAGL